MSFLASSQVLELNIISAEELAPVARCMKTYAIAWLDPERKLMTRVDNTGGTSPTWNDKFVFRLEEEEIYDESSIMVIEIYALHWFKDIHVGTVQTLVKDLVTPSSAMRFVTLEVLRVSGRPHGLLNIAVGLIDNSGHSMPLVYEDDLLLHNKNISSKPLGLLRRSKSDTSSMVESPRKMAQQNHKSSTTNSNEFSSDSQMVVYAPPKQVMHGKRGGDLPLHGTPMRPRNTTTYTPKRNKVEYGTPMRNKVEYETPMRSRPVVITESELGPSASVVAAQIAKEKAWNDVESTVISVDERSVEGLRTKLGRWQANLPVVVDVGSSYQPSSDYKTSTNFKPKSSYKANETNPRNPMNRAIVEKENGKNKKGEDNGLFSCFSNICGVECSIVCGGSNGQKVSKKKKKK